MENSKEKLSINMNYAEAQTIPLALHEMHMARYSRLLRWLCVAWAVSVVAVVGIFTWLWCQYDYESSTVSRRLVRIIDKIERTAARLKLI